MKLILAAVEKSLADAWRKFCGDLDFVAAHHGSILEADCDAVVSPANSYGFSVLTAAHLAIAVIGHRPPFPHRRQRATL